MSKTQILIVVMLLIVGAGVATGAFWLLKGNTTSSSKIILPRISLTENTEITGDLTYSDPSGFNFKYPTGFAVSELPNSDESYYALLAVTKGAGQIKLSAKDTLADSVDGWVKEAKKTGLTLVGATTMGGMKATQYQDGVNLLTVAVDGGVVYAIEGPKDGGILEDTQNVIVSSFAFENPESSQNPSGGAADDTIYEEEVVE